MKLNKFITFRFLDVIACYAGRISLDILLETGKLIYYSRCLDKFSLTHVSPIQTQILIKQIKLLLRISIISYETELNKLGYTILTIISFKSDPIK